MSNNNSTGLRERAAALLVDADEAEARELMDRDVTFWDLERPRLLAACYDAGQTVELLRETEKGSGRFVSYSIAINGGHGLLRPVGHRWDGSGLGLGGPFDTWHEVLAHVTLLSRLSNGALRWIEAGK